MRKHVKARQERNRELGRMDAANRCTFCKKALTEWIEDFLEPGRFCDDECMSAAVEAAEQRQAMKGRRS